MKFIALLLLSVVALHAAPKVEVEWTFEKKPAEINPATNVRFQPAQKLKVLIPMGKSHAVNEMTETPLPLMFAPPEPRTTENGILIPSTPLAFRTETSGYKLEFEAEQTGPYIRIVGVLVMRDIRLEQGVFGEESAPIYTDAVVDGKKQRILLSPNNADTARVQSTESRFQVNALPGKTYTVTLQSPQGPIKAKVRCKLKA